MKKKTILAIAAVVVAVALIAIIAIAVKNKHQETGGDKPSITDVPGPDKDTGDVVVDKKTGSLKIEDDLYPFTLNINDDGTLTVTMDGTAPSGFEWGEAEFRNEELFSVSKESANTYRIAGNTIGSDVITLPLKRNEGANEVIAEIKLNVEIGRDTTYITTGQMTEEVAGKIISIPILEAVSEIDKGVTVLEYMLEKYDIPNEGEIIYRSAVSDYHPYQIRVMDDGRKYEIALQGTDKNWTISSGNTDNYTLEGPTVTDSQVVTTINILPRIEDEDDEEEEDEEDEEDENKPRLVTIEIVNHELNLCFEMTLCANADGTSTISSHGTSVYEVPMLTDEYIEEEPSEGTEE